MTVFRCCVCMCVPYLLQLDAEEAKNPPKSRELEERVANLNMPEDEMEEKEQLIEAGFSNWKWRDFRTFVSACEKHGRANRAAVVAEVTEMCEKSVEDVEQYFEAFWEKGPQCISDWKKLNDRIVKGEQRIAVRKLVRLLVGTLCHRRCVPVVFWCVAASHRYRESHCCQGRPPPKSVGVAHHRLRQFQGQGLDSRGRPLPPCYAAPARVRCVGLHPQ